MFDRCASVAGAGASRSGPSGPVPPPTPMSPTVPDPVRPAVPDEMPMSSEPHESAEPLDPSEPDAPGGNGEHLAGDAATEPVGTRAAGDVVEAVAEFLDDLIDDTGFAHDPCQAPDAR